MKLNMIKGLFVLFFLLPGSILQASNADCLRLNKQMTMLKEQFNEPDGKIIQRYKDKIRKNLNSVKNEITSLQSQLSRPQQLIYEARQNEGRKIISYKEYLAREEREFARANDAVLLEAKKKSLQQQISIGTILLHQKYYDQLTKQDIDNENTMIQSSFEKSLREAKALQLLPDSELLQKIKNEFQDTINAVKNEIEEMKKIVKSDDLLLQREQKNIEESLDYYKTSYAKLQKTLQQQDHILLQKAKNAIQKRFSGMYMRYQAHCQAD